MTREAPPPPPLPAPVPARIPLEAPRYLRDLRALLETSEPELWRWFAESTAQADEAGQVGAEVELLKSAIQLTGPHSATRAEAVLLAARLGIDDDIEVYQAFDDQGRNARVQIFGGVIHIVFSGDLLDLLNDAEVRVVLLHELAHVALWRIDGGAYRILDAMIHRLADESPAEAVAESARRVLLHTEVWADRVARAILGDLPTVVATLIKTGSGLRHVDPQAYLRQAERILADDTGASTAWTHPENHIRVACLALPDDGAGTADRIAELVEGPDDLDRIDLLGQRRLQRLSAAILTGGANALGAASARDGVAAYLASYPTPPPDPSAPAGTAASRPATAALGAQAFAPTEQQTRPLNDEAMRDATPSVRHLGAALLVDLAMTDDALSGPDELRKLSREAARVGVEAEFDKILAKATDRTLSEARRLRDDRENPADPDPDTDPDTGTNTDPDTDPDTDPGTLGGRR